jgi:iron complex outermembrane recepter protein
MKEYSRLQVFVLAVLSVALSEKSAVAAQETASSEPGADDTVIAEVLVQGRKPLNDTHTVNVGAFGSKDVLDIPISIQTYSSELMENLRARTLNDILKNDSSVQNAAVGGAYDHVRIRGFPVDWTNTMRVDGLSLAPYQDVPLENIDRVDVLKGPSGFLYGYNSPGGTVNYLLKRPTLNPFLAVTAEVRSYDGYYVHADTSDTLGKNNGIGYRFNAAYEEVGDFTHNFDIERYVVGLNTDFKIGERGVLQVNLDHQNKKTAAQPLIGLQPDGNLPPEVSPRALLGQPWVQYEADVYNAGVRYDHSLTEDWFLVGQAAYARNERVAAFVDILSVGANGDVLDGDIVISPGQTYETMSSQLFLSGKVKTGPIQHELVTGLSSRYYEAREGGYIFLPTTVGNILSPVYSPKPALPAAPPKNKVDNHQNALFFSDLLTFNEQWQALAGVRYVQYYNRLQRPNQAAAAPYEQNSTVPSLGLIFKPTSRVTTYVSYAEGLEQGGVAPFNTANAGEYQDPIESEQIELGVKTALTDLVTVTLSLFQIEKGLEFVNADNVYVQDGRQQHRGVELQTQGAVTQRLFLTAGATYLDTELRRTGDLATEGNRTENVPEWQASVYADYALRFVDGLHVSGGYYYVGDRAVNAQNTTFIDAYSRVDLGATYRLPIFDRPLVLRAQVKNLTDERYWAAAEFASVYPGEPRTYYFSIQAEF